MLEMLFVGLGEAGEVEVPALGGLDVEIDHAQHIDEGLVLYRLVRRG